MDTAPPKVESKSAFLSKKQNRRNCVFFSKKGTSGILERPTGSIKKVTELKNRRNTNYVRFEAKHSVLLRRNYDNTVRKCTFQIGARYAWPNLWKVVQKVPKKTWSNNAFFVFLETFCVGYHERLQDFKKSAKVHFLTTCFNHSVPELPRPTLGVIFGTLKMDTIGVSWKACLQNRLDKSENLHCYEGYGLKR